MRPKRDPVPRAREAWRWLGGMALLGVLGGGVAVAAVLLWENVDIRQLTPTLVRAPGGLPVPDHPAPPAVDGRPFVAALLVSARNRDYFPDSAYYDAEIERWRRLASDVGGTVRDVRDAGGLRSVSRDEVLVLPEAPCLSAAELSAIRGHVARGGSVVSNWATGARNADCAWRGWAPLLELTGADAAQELPAGDASYLTVPSGIALASGIDPGTRIELRPGPSLGLRVSGPHAFWSDWALNPAPDPAGLGTDVGAVAIRTSAGGRIAWFGMRLGQAATEHDDDRLGRLVRNGVLWAAGVPTATIAAWPDAARAAMVFTLDVEDRPESAVGVADLLQAEGIPGTFFVVSGMVAGDEALARALAGRVEVGSQTADHTAVAGLTAQDQTMRLRRSRDDIEEWTGVAPTGLRPPEDAFDSTTLAAWSRSGGKYVLARNEGRSASPEVHRTEEGIMVLLPRLLKDDYNLVVQDRAMRADRIGEAYLQGTRKLYAIGGLAVVAGHTQIMQTPTRVAAFRMVGDTARARGDWWIARADAVAAWWRARTAAHLVFVSGTERSDRNGSGSDASEPPPPPAAGTARPSADITDLVVRAGAGEPLRGAWVDIVLPQGSDGLVPLVDGRPVDYQTTEWGVRIPVGPLEGGAEVLVSLLRVAPPSGGAAARPQ